MTSKTEPTQESRALAKAAMQAFSASPSTVDPECEGPHQRYRLNEPPMRDWCCDVLALARVIDKAKGDAWEEGALRGLVTADWEYGAPDAPTEQPSADNPYRKADR